MKDFLETTLGRIILGVIVLLIWGVNAFNFSQLANQDISTVSTPVFKKEEVTLPLKINYVYKANSRDPFVQSGYSMVQAERSIVDKPIENLPEITLNGIFEKSVMLTINGNEIIFKSAGEFIADGILLKRIFADSVHLETDTQLITLTVKE